jgi:Domain of unknown function (DUF4265)
MEKLPKEGEHTRILFWLEHYETDGGMWPPYESEGLWALVDGDGHYVLDNIPLYIRGVSLDDVVTASNQDGKLVFQSVFRKGGHSTFRALLRDGVSFENKQVGALLKAIRESGCTYEGADRILFAFDVPPEVRADLVYVALQLGVERNLWDVEIGSYDGPTSG